MRADTSERRSGQIRKVLRHVAANLEKPYTIKDLSKIACFAPFHFHRVFREITGEPVHRYIRQLRLEFSAHQLLFTDRSIIQVALKVGYQSHEAYTRAFQQAFGMAPSRFRMRFRQRSGSEHGPAPRDGAPAMESGASKVHALLQPGRTPRRQVAYCSYFGPYTELQQSWRKLLDVMRGLNLSPDAVQAIGIMYDDPLCCIDGNIRYDACIVLPPHVQVGPALGNQTLPEMDTISAVHHGPHELTVHAYVRLINQWVSWGGGRGLQRLPCYEVYRRFPFLGTDDEVDVEVHVRLR